MKTPMQEVYENFNLMSDADFKAWMLNTDLLEKEEEVMCEFADKYRDDSCFATFSGDVSSKQTTEEFFELTFNTKER